MARPLPYLPVKLERNQGRTAMTQTRRSRSIQSISQYNAEDYIWGMPESPEVSVVHGLINEFKTHEGDEEKWLLSYRKTAADCDDPMFRFLLNLIIGDEERHHQLIGRMIANLKDDLGSTRTSEPPPGTATSVTPARELVVMVERFLGIERKGIREYERLKKTSQRFRQGLLALLCETMVYDSLKHIGILNFLRHKLKEEQRRGVKKKAPRSR
jgi:hypothetical protein